MAITIKRQYALVYGLGVFFIFSLVGYKLNGGTPSVPWAVAGGLAGAALAVLVRRRVRG
ncbi:hypothetical protein ACIRQY_24990 [Streptomyces sp. NPDC101490]|uniref:hypothetical protein n=1 Tax=Streptomyces sp. NPDC101490 TaxID=3366143 RepID=UPI003803B310